MTRDPAILRSPSGHGLGKALGSKKASISLLVVLTAGVRVDNMARLEKYYIRVSTQTLWVSSTARITVFIRTPTYE